MKKQQTLVMAVIWCFSMLLVACASTTQHRYRVNGTPLEVEMHFEVSGETVEKVTLRVTAVYKKLGVTREEMEAQIDKGVVLPAGNQEVPGMTEEKTVTDESLQVVRTYVLHDPDVVTDLVETHGVLPASAVKEGKVSWPLLEEALQKQDVTKLP